MIVQQDRLKPRQWARAEPREATTDGDDDGSEEEDHAIAGLDFRKGYLRAQLLRKDPGLQKKPTLRDYLSDHLFKILLVGLLFLSALILITVRNRGDTAALFCIESLAKESSQSIPYPHVDFKKVGKSLDKGKYGIVRAEKWIVVAVLGPPTEEIRALVRMQGWQVLAVGNSESPIDWDVKGAIFLSVEQQAALGYRILAHLPYNSYVRKSVGYLFAIQHGAKVIYDGDENASLLAGDLGRLFDVELTGPSSRNVPLMQYNLGHNRTCVNPYIHFGQRSVWPRGLPLEYVSNINPDVYYGQIFSGQQFMQQGLANGLPDVDSVFYYTRKSSSEEFDISFDSHTPPVALPQGLMAPVNNFNTLFHSSAFWGLMLPVSVSSKASDIFRGYWTQRLLWEIGGFLIIYPPSIRRKDNMKSPSFEDEKDLHESAGKLTHFLVSWRSNKRTLFQKIIHLSHSMAEAGFWTAQDVIYTAAWLQDLISVGYVQPRLLTLELDNPRPSLHHADHLEFLPLRLPSMHLGVEEAASVNFEFGNLLRWRNFFGNMVMVLHCSWPVNQTALGWKMLYGRIFKSVVLISDENDVNFGVERTEWWQVYKTLPKIFDTHPNAEGFLFMKDDIALNYWNLLQANKTKLWNAHKVTELWRIVAYNATEDEWYHKSSMKSRLQKMISSLPVHFQITYRGNVNEDQFVVCNSDIFYVPRYFVGDFADLVNLAVKENLPHELALPLFFLSLDSLDNFDSEVFSKVVYMTDNAFNPVSYYSAEAQFIHPWKVTNELDLLNLMKSMSLGDPLLLEVF